MSQLGLRDELLMGTAGKRAFAVAVSSSTAAAVGETGCLQLVFEGEGPKARGLVLLPLAPLPREERVPGHRSRGDRERDDSGASWARVVLAGAGPAARARPGGGPGRSPPSPQAPFRVGRPVHSTHFLGSSRSVVDQKVLCASRR